MDLSQLKFAVDTTELDRAGKAIGELVVNVGKLDKASKDVARTEATLAKAAKDNAKANLDNAKAQQATAKAVESTEKAQKSAAAAVAKSTSILERQKDILGFQTQGFSKGQSSILAYGKAAGLAATDIGELGKVLETQRKLMGQDPFDKSLSGIKSLQNQYTELKESVRQYNTDSNLSAKQTRELARDKERLIEKLKVEGASFSDIRKAVRAHNDEYVNLASAYNKMTSAEDAVIKSRKDAVTATNYLTQADQKMAAALNMSNSALDKAGTDSLVRYESALRKSGLAQDVVSTKLAAYKSQLVQVQAQEAKRAEQHLARALSPQLTDVAVSLYSGQAPLTVLLQQGGQIADLLRLSGVEAQNFGKALRDSFSSMIPVMATVAKGLSGFFFSLAYDAGKGITNFIGNVTGMNKVLQHTDDLLFLVGGRATQLSKVLATLGAVASATFGAGVFAIVAGLGALAVGLKQVITENNDIAKSFALSGASIGLSHTQVIEYVKTLADSGATTGQATEALLAMAKAGTFTSKEILLVSDSAIQMQKGFGIAIEDTVKQFAKLKEKPVEALLEIAKTTGMVGPEIIKMVQELMSAGKASDAAALAMKAYGDVTKEQISQMKENYNGFSLFMIKLGQGIKQFFSDTFKVLFLATDPTRQLENQLGSVRDRIKEVSGNLQGLGSFGDPKLLNSLKEQERSLIAQIGANVRLAGEEEKRKAINSESAKVQEASLKLIKAADDATEKDLRKTMNLADFRKSYINDKLKDAAKEYSIDVEKLKLNKELMSVLEKSADIEFKKSNKSSTKQEAKDLDAYADILNKVNGVTSSYNNELTGLQRLREKGKITEQQYVQAVQDLVSTQPFYIKQQKEINDAEEFRLRLLGESDGIGKQYYADMLKLAEYAKVAGWSAEQVEQLTAAIYKGTPAWKAHEKALEAVNTATTKFREDSIATQAAVTKENESLDYRISLLGQTTEEQRILAIEYTRSNKLREVDVKLAKELREIEEKITKAKKAGLPDNEYQSLIDAQIQAEKDAADQRKVINREVAVQYAEDLDKEFRAIKDGITESIVAALFDGGKEGSKKLREILVSTLRKKVTIVVDAVVNTLVGSVVGSLFGGTTANSSSTGGTSSLLNTLSNGSSLANLVTGGYAGALGSGVSALFGQAAGNAAIGTALTGSASSASAAALAAAQAGGTATASTAGMASLGSGIATAAPYIAAAIAVYSLFKGKKKPSSSLGGTWAAYDANGARTAYDPYYDTKAGTTAYADNIVQSMQDTYTTTAKALGIDTAATNWSYRANTGKNGENPNFSLTGGAGGSSYSQSWTTISDEAVELAASRAVLAALKGSTLPEHLSGVFDDISASTATQDAIDTALAYAQSLATLHTALLSLPFDKLTNASYDSMEAILELAGGVTTFSSLLSTYYQNYYSETEQAATMTASLSKVFADLGMSMPSSKAAFRDLVDSLDLTTTTGQATYTTLLNASSAFASLSDAVTTMTQSVVDEAKRIRALIAGDSTNSLATAQTAFAVGTAQARAGDETALAGLAELSQNLLTLAESNAATSVDLARIRALTASSLETTAATVASSYGIKLPSYDVGTNYVPRDMIAQIHEGEAIVPRAYNPDAGNTSSSNDSGNTEVVAALKSLRDDVNAALRAIAANTSKSTKLLERVTQDGEAMQTVPAT